MKKFLLLLLIIFPLISTAQGEASWWFFGTNAGLDFNSGNPLSVTVGALATAEGCSTISDACGNLLMYSDGTTIWNANHQPMPNGTGLSGSSSSAQSAIIIPDLDSSNVYFVVTISAGAGLRYSIVDMNLAGGLGDVVPNRRDILIQSNTQEKVTATLNDAGDRYWIVTFDNGGQYSSYFAGGGFISTNPATVTRSNLAQTASLSTPRGYLRLSPDGTKIVNCSVGNPGTAWLCDFDNATGVVSNPIGLSNSTSSVNRFYGAEFSPNSQLVYLNANTQDTGNGCGTSNTREVLQFNPAGGAGWNSNPVSLSGVSTVASGRAALQLGIDGRIYHARVCQPWLGMIESPNTVGNGATYIADAVPLTAPTVSREGLPPFITSFFTPSFLATDANQGSGGGNVNAQTDFCNGTPVQFNSTGSGLCAAATVNWDFGDGTTSNLFDPVHTFPAPGDYNVVLSVTSGFYSNTAEQIISIYELPVADPVADVFLCDSDMSGDEVRDLDIIEAPQVIGTQTSPNFEVTYFLTQNNADNNLGAITNPYTFSVGTTTIYARITNIFNTASEDCYDIVNFDVIVASGSGATMPDDINICDDDNDGFWIFDLTSVETEVLDGLPASQFVISYHNTAADAAADANAITNPTTYTNTTASTTETIHVRLEDQNPGGCTSTTSFDISVFDTPTANPVNDFRICDLSNDSTEIIDLSQFDTQIVGAQTNVNYAVSYFNDQTDADANTNALTANTFDLNVSNRTVVARIDNNLNEDCFNTVVINLFLDVQPVANPVAIYRLCDDVSNNGSEVFDLASRNPEVLDTQNAADFNIEYFTSQADADLGSVGGATPVINNYSSGGQTMYVRIESIANTNCHDTTTFDIIVDDIPVATTPADLILCDDDTNDGVATVDLATEFDADVLNGQTQTTFVVTYHANQADADADANPLTSPLSVSLGTTTIIARIDNTDNETCASTAPIDIILTPQAVANPVTEFRLCDDITADGLENFDLTTKDTEVLDTQNPADFNIEYFTSQTDADLGSAGGAIPLVSPYNSGNTTIFVRIETAANTDCFNTESFDLFVDTTPEATSPIDLVICDDDTNDGVATVDLATEFDADVLNGQTQTTFVVTYHANQADADADANALTSPLSVNLGTTTIIARVDNADNEGCVSTAAINIILNEQAVANPVSEFRECDDITNDGLADFDLSTKDSEVLGTQNPADFNIEYFTSQADADLGSAGGAVPLVSPYNSGSATIFVRIETATNSDCFNTETFDLFVDELPIAGTPADIVVCDDPSNDGVEDVDLSQFDSAILDGQTNPNFIVSYHASQADADSDANALASPYTVSASTPNLFARIDNGDNNDCFNTSTFQFVIRSTPTANDVMDMIDCDDPSNDGIAVFDLGVANDQVLGNQDPTNNTITYHSSQSDADANLNPLPLSYTSTSSTPETIYVRIENNFNDQCSDVTSFTLTVSLQPTAGIAVDQRGCDDASNDGIEEFDFTNVDTEILNGQSAADYEVTYHTSLNDADNDANSISFPYTNVSSPQTIYARIENRVNSDCYDVSFFDIEVFERPVIANQGPITICAGVDEVLDAGAGYSSYLWSTGETTQTITVNTGADYDVTVTNANGCDTTATVVVIESDVAVIERIDIDQFNMTNNMITAIVSGSGDYDFSLDNFIYQDSPRFDNLFPGFYTVYVRDKNGCGIVSQDVVIIGGPQFFTPNQDGFNDTWQVIAIETVEDANIYIFDRFGKLLKQISPTGAGWDGTYNGNPMPSSDYWYKVELSDGRSFRGHFALKR